MSLVITKSVILIDYTFNKSVKIGEVASQPVSAW